MYCYKQLMGTDKMLLGCNYLEYWMTCSPTLDHLVLFLMRKLSVCTYGLLQHRFSILEVFEPLEYYFYTCIFSTCMKFFYDITAGCKCELL